MSAFAAELLDVPEVTGQQPVKAHEIIRLADLKAPSSEDGQELIKDRYQCRGQATLIVGPTGAGKSAFAMQGGMLFSVGKPCFGLRPARSFKILYIQAENDSGDLYEIRNGIYEGLEFNKQEVRTAGENFYIVTVNDCVGAAFVSHVFEPLLEQLTPDLVIVDPLLAFLGADVSKQDLVSLFVRSGLQPAIGKARCGLWLVHHPPKPRQDRGEVKAGDDNYFGAGSADLSNWARAVIVLKPTSHHGIYKLRLAKRAQRAGWVEADGQTPSFERAIAHGRNGLIYWRDAEPGEIFTPVATDSAKADLLALVPSDSPLEKEALLSRAGNKSIGVNRARLLIAELVAEGRLFEWRIPRPRTNPKIALARNPQPSSDTHE